MKLICCSGFPEIYSQIEERDMSAMGIVCILLYVKLIWCSSFPEIYGQLEEGVMSDLGMSVCLAFGICAFFYM